VRVHIALGVDGVCSQLSVSQVRNQQF
jgi:hypothetical protein